MVCVFIINCDLFFDNKSKMPLEDFELLEDLGKGAFGVVKKCKRKIDG